jgi:hypothetical protein
VLLAHHLDQTIEERRLPAQQATQGGAGDIGALRLFDEEVAEQRVAGKVAPQNGVERNADARGQAGLREQGRRDAGSVALT